MTGFCVYFVFASKAAAQRRKRGQKLAFKVQNANFEGQYSIIFAVKILSKQKFTNPAILRCRTQGKPDQSLLFVFTKWQIAI